MESTLEKERTQGRLITPRLTDIEMGWLPIKEYEGKGSRLIPLKKAGEEMQRI